MVTGMITIREIRSLSISTNLYKMLSWESQSSTNTARIGSNSAFGSWVAVDSLAPITSSLLLSSLDPCMRGNVSVLTQRVNATESWRDLYYLVLLSNSWHAQRILAKAARYYRCLLRLEDCMYPCPHSSLGIALHRPYQDQPRQYSTHGRKVGLCPG